MNQKIMTTFNQYNISDINNFHSSLIPLIPTTPTKNSKQTYRNQKSSPQFVSDIFLQKTAPIYSKSTVKYPQTT